MGNYKEDTKKIDFYTKNSIKCHCGHTNFLGSKQKIICSWCGYYVFKNKKDEFEYRTKEEIRNEFNKCRIN